MTLPSSYGATYDFASLMRPRMWGSTEMTLFRTRNHPGRPDPRALDQRENHMGRPTAREELDLTDNGPGFSLSGVLLAAMGASDLGTSLDDELHRDVASHRVGIQAHLVRDLDELTTQRLVGPLGQFTCSATARPSPLGRCRRG